MAVLARYFYAFPRTTRLASRFEAFGQEREPLVDSLVSSLRCFIIMERSHFIGSKRCIPLHPLLSAGIVSLSARSPGPCTDRARSVATGWRLSSFGPACCRSLSGVCAGSCFVEVTDAHGNGKSPMVKKGGTPKQAARGMLPIPGLSLACLCSCWRACCLYRRLVRTMDRRSAAARGGSCAGGVGNARAVEWCALLRRGL